MRHIGFFHDSPERNPLKRRLGRLGWLWRQLYYCAQSACLCPFGRVRQPPNIRSRLRFHPAITV